MDIDMTMIHAVANYTTKKCFNKARDLMLDKKAREIIVEQRNGQFLFCAILFRPHLFEFLKLVSKFCVIYVYTHGTKNYGIEVIKAIDPEMKYFSLDRFRSIQRDPQGFVYRKSLDCFFPRCRQEPDGSDEVMRDILNSK